MEYEPIRINSSQMDPYIDKVVQMTNFSENMVTTAFYAVLQDAWNNEEYTIKLEEISARVIILLTKGRHNG